MTRIWLRGTPISVVQQEDVLLVFIWNKRKHPIERVDNRWQIESEWWRLRIFRDYFRLHTTTGLIAVIFHDRVTDEWYLERLYD